jgi:tetratricopeptide (TPR) repeat protein
MAGEGGAGDQGARWYLNDEREFLQRSLEDADREHDAGDLSDEDHEILMARDRKRLAEVDVELASFGPLPEDHRVAGPIPAPAPDSVPRSMSGWRRLGIVAACLMIVLGAVILVNHARQARLPGQASSGSITESQAQQIAQQLSQAQALENNSKTTVQALALYNKVLAVDPSDPVALAGAGWIEWTIGFDAHRPSIVTIGRQEVEKAVKVSPTYSQAHLYMGLILENQDDNSSGAVTQFNQFLADDPSTQEVQQVAPQVDGAYLAAGVPIPAVLKIPTTTSTSAP